MKMSEVTLGRRILGSLAFAGLGFIVGFLLTFGIGEPTFWFIVGIAVAVICGVYGAIFGDPWLRRRAAKAK